MTTILALDTATNACSAAFWDDGKITARRFELMPRGHAERLVPMISEVTNEAGRAAKDVDLIAVTVGPGAFTGMRVGLATARALALAAGVPCLGLTSLEVIAAGVGDTAGRLIVGLDSKRADLFVQVFDGSGRAMSEAAAVMPAALATWVSPYFMATQSLTAAGDAAADVVALLSEAGTACAPADVPYPDAAVLAQVAAVRWSPGDVVPRPAPLYLRPPDAVVPVNGGRLRP